MFRSLSGRLQVLNRDTPWCVCRNCGKKFQAGADRKRTRCSISKSPVGRQMACSPRCAAERREVLRIKRTVCVVCGGNKNSGSSKTCSPDCSAVLKRQSMTGKTYNLCHYTAPDMFDYRNMLDILHRKGYVKAKDTKEKWTYTTDGFPGISWVDRVARETVVSGKASTRKEQQGHEDGVQFQVEEIGASAMSLEKFLSSTQVGAALLEATMGIKPTYRR